MSAPASRFLHPAEPSSIDDDAVRGTNDDATISKLSAVSLHYLHDPFIDHFVKKNYHDRRPPIINRGTYARTVAIDTLVLRFLEGGNEGQLKQVVSLGAGSDTRYFCLKKQQPHLMASTNLHRYVELDFPHLTSSKARTITKISPKLFPPSGYRVGGGGTELYADQYRLISGDLRDWDACVQRLLNEEGGGLNLSLPTLFLSECVLMYISPAISTKIIRWCGEVFTGGVSFVIYEPIRPDDAFGQVMLRNLRARDITLESIHTYPTLDSQRSRFLEEGWKYAEAIDIRVLMEQYWDPAEITRVNMLEILDELEEWNLLASHYCICWAYKSGVYPEKDPLWLSTVWFNSTEENKNRIKALGEFGDLPPELKNGFGGTRSEAGFMMGDRKIFE